MSLVLTLTLRQLFCSQVLGSSFILAIIERVNNNDDDNNHNKKITNKVMMMITIIIIITTIIIIMKLSNAKRCSQKTSRYCYILL